MHILAGLDRFKRMQRDLKNHSIQRRLRDLEGNARKVNCDLIITPIERKLIKSVHDAEADVKFVLEHLRMLPIYLFLIGLTIYLI